MTTPNRDDDYRAVIAGIRAARMAEAVQKADPHFVGTVTIPPREVEVIAWERGGGHE